MIDNDDNKNTEMKEEEEERQKDVEWTRNDDYETRKCNNHFKDQLRLYIHI